MPHLSCLNTHPQCEYDNKTDDCHKPNPWIAWLRTNAGAGHTRAQLSHQYQQFKNHHHTPLQLQEATCRNVRRMGCSHRRTFGLPHTQPCLALDSFISELPETPPTAQNYKDIWVRVFQDAQKPIGGRWSVNFHNPAEFTVAKLMKIARLVDKWFMNNTLLPRLTATNFPLLIAFPAVPVAGVAMSAARVEGHSRLSVHAGNIIAEHMPIVSDGTLCTTRLGWVCHVIAHELVHLIIANFCPDDEGGHGLMFRNLNRRLFGHSMHNYQYDPGYDIEQIDD